MHTLTIAKREIGSFFKSPIGYIVIPVYLLLHGVWFFVIGQNVFAGGQASMELFFARMPLLFAIICPAIAMRLLAEERGSGTIELLLTMPVRDTAVVVGKYLGAVAILAVALLMTVPYAITIAAIGPLDMGPVIAGYLGALLLGGMYLAIGLVTSSATKNQIIALIVSVVICLALHFAADAIFAVPRGVAVVILLFSPTYHFEQLARGVIELRDVVYYVSIIGVLLVASVQILEARKWR
jgi:ABC-2 type transport system permease protein